MAGTDDCGVPGPLAHNTINCAECGRSSDSLWIGWGAYRVEDPEAGEPPELALFCPFCISRELDRSRRV
jgi:hypothetical protein